MNKEQNYVKQVSVFKMATKEGTKRVLSLFDKMFPIEENNEKDKSLPYDFCSAYSRMEAQLIEKIGNQTKICVVNLEPSEVINLCKKTNSILTIKMAKEFGLIGVPARAATVPTTSSETVNSPCYTVQFRMGPLKGKTPAQVNNKEELEKQKSFLAQNVAKYPDNQKIIDAIDDYLSKVSNGTFNSTAASQPSTQPQASGLTPVILIDEQEKTRMSSKIEVEETMENGKKKKVEKFLITGIKVVCDLTRNVPINVKITNYYAPVIKTSTGSQNIEKTKGEQKKEVAINMSFENWMAYISDGGNFIKAFKAKEADRCFDLAEKYCWHPDSTKGSSNGNNSQTGSTQGKADNQNARQEQQTQGSVNSSSSTQPKAEHSEQPKEAKQNEEKPTLVSLELRATTDCVPRTQNKNDYCMRTVDTDTGAQINVVFSHIVISAISNWDKFLERSQDRETPLSFKGVFEVVNENGLVIHQFVEFAK